MTDTERLAAILVAWLEGDQAARDRALVDARAALAAIRSGEPIPEIDHVEAEAVRTQARDGNRLVREALDRHRGQDADPTGTDPSFHGGLSGFASTVRKPVE